MDRSRRNFLAAGLALPRREASRRPAVVAGNLQSAAAARVPFTRRWERRVEVTTVGMGA